MVGVRGKYKGCETCRRRRVKCDNTRPFCDKCLKNGRKCEGYEPERVFITAGIEDGGRCSSHPRRRVGSSSKSRSPESRSPDETQQFALEPTPGCSAWDRVVTLSSREAQHTVPVIAVHVDPRSMVRVDAGGGWLIDNAVYSIPDIQVPFGENFDVAGQCLVHISGQDACRNLCAFVYESHSSPLQSGETLLSGPEPDETSGVRSKGPQAFQTFPTHHFFARIYRPLVIGQALLNRRRTFLASPEWTTIPWTTHPKTPLDSLFNILSHIPELLSRTDALFSTTQTPNLQYAFQGLYTKAQEIEARLDAWHAAVMPGHWLDDSDALHIPFGSAFAFRDGPSALACVYYWLGLLLFRPAVVALRRATIPHYGFEGNEQEALAGGICRSLDFALGNTAQPDLLVAPLLAVERYFQGRGGQGTLEMVWCAGFRERLEVKGEHLERLLQGVKWAELARF